MKKINSRKPIFVAAGIVGAIAVFGVGYGAGSSGTPEPRVETIIEKPEPITVKEEVPVVPQACLDAIDNGAAALDSAGEGFLIAADAIEAAFKWDADLLDSLTSDLDPVSQSFLSSKDQFVIDGAACKTEGK